MQIRFATESDVPDVLPMVAKIAALHEKWDSAKYGYRDNPEEMYRGWLIARSEDERSVFLVADREPEASAAGPRLVGFLIATVDREIPIYRLQEYGFIHDLWVEPDYRNEGVARQMVMLAIERFKEIGVRQIRLDTAAHNDPARRLFAACGFRPSTTEMLIEM